MAIVFKPTASIKVTNRLESSPLRIFLAGTIDMGDSIDWQQDITDKIGDRSAYIFNPRRTEWDSSWQQNIHEKQFVDQVTWELDNLEQSDIIVINILGTSKSPITLLELGLFIGRTDKKIFVCVGEDFYRKGNIDIVCSRHCINVYTEYDKMSNDLLDYMDSTYERVAT